jgi:hypothetical protein
VLGEARIQIRGFRFVNKSCGPGARGLHNEYLGNISPWYLGEIFLSNRKRGNCERKKEERGQKNGNYQLNGETNAKLGK